MAILLSGDTFVNTASPRKFHFILESLKLRSARVQFLRVVRNRFQQTNPFTVFLGCNRNKNQLGFFFLARRSNKKKPRVYKTDNNGKIDSSLKQLKIVFWQKMLTWSTTALCDYTQRIFGSFFLVFKNIFFPSCCCIPILTGWLLSCYFSSYWQGNEPVLYNLPLSPTPFQETFPLLPGWNPFLTQWQVFWALYSTFFHVEEVQEGEELQIYLHKVLQSGF